LLEGLDMKVSTLRRTCRQRFSPLTATPSEDLARERLKRAYRTNVYEIRHAQAQP
jgi:hypothetical protein